MFNAKNIVQQLQYFTKICRMGMNVKNSLSPCIGERFAKMSNFIMLLHKLLLRYSIYYVGHACAL